MEQKLRVGIIGVGAIATMMHIPTFKATGRAKVTAICRRTKRLLDMAKEHLGVEEAYTDWREMLDKADLDAVVVSTPNNLHAEQVIAALDKGLHVMVDKPLALKSEDAWAMVKFAKQSNRVLMVAYNGRLTGKARAIKTTLDQDRIGQIRQVVNTHVTRYNWWFESRVIPDYIQKFAKSFSGMPDEFFYNGIIPGDYWRGDTIQGGGGAFTDVGTHFVDRALWYGGAPAAEVEAFVDNGSSKVDRYVSAHARLTNDVLVTLTVSDIEADYDYSQLTVVGDDGVVTMDEGDEGRIWLKTKDGRVEIQPDGPDLYPAFPFVSSILDGAPNLIPGEAGAHAVAFVEAVYQSAAEKRIVTLAPRPK
jgi:predicted dehydrogenase